MPITCLYTYRRVIVLSAVALFSVSLVFEVWSGILFTMSVSIIVQQDATVHSLFYLQTALHVSGVS